MASGIPSVALAAQRLAALRQALVIQLRTADGIRSQVPAERIG
jgi:hypothetical protein